MTKVTTKQSSQHIVREVTRRIVPMALEATGHAGCIAHAKKLRALADDASMDDISRAVKSAADAGPAVGAAVGAAYDAAADAVAYADFDSATANAAGAFAAGDTAQKEYAAILAEAMALAN